MNRHFTAVVTGSPCSFWPRGEWKTAADAPEWDAEQYIAVFVAVRRACAAIGATDAQRWMIVEAKLRELAERYAEAQS